MADLKYADEIQSAFGDNTQGLISPSDSRDAFDSMLSGHGFLSTNTETTIPILDGTWTQINPLLVDVTTAPEQLWSIDGNNLFVPVYSTQPQMTVPEGYQKLCSFVSVISLRKDLSGSDDYLAQWVEDGVGVGLAESISFSAAGEQVETMLYSSSVLIGEAHTFGMQIMGVGTTDELHITYMSQQVTDSILISAPVAP